MKTAKLEFIAKITTPDGKEILKRVSEDIPSEEAFDPSSVEKFMSALNEYEKHALNARNSICEEITQAWLDEQAKKGHNSSETNKSRRTIDCEIDAFSVSLEKNATTGMKPKQHLVSCAYSSLYLDLATMLSYRNVS